MHTEDLPDGTKYKVSDVSYVYYGLLLQKIPLTAGTRSLIP